MAGMFSRQANGTLVELKEQPYENEDIFQELLAQYPNLIPGDQINSENHVRLMLLTREAGIADSEDSADRWNIDLLFVDQDAMLTLVEVKRSSDARIRREVVGQVLEYAANAVAYWSTERLREVFAANCAKQGENPDEELQQFIGGEEANAALFWERVETNLKAGKIRLLFVADKIPNELCRIIEFLNTNMQSVEVLGIECKQFVGDNVQTLVSRVLGQSAIKEHKKSGGYAPRDWNEDSFFATLQKTNPQAVEIARKIYEWAKQQELEIKWGKGRIQGTFHPITCESKRNDMFSVVNDGKIWLNLNYMNPPYHEPRQREALVASINAITALSLPSKGNPSVPLTLLHEEAKLRQFLDLYADYARAVKSGK
jgi:hypothetical protein